MKRFWSTSCAAVVTSSIWVSGCGGDAGPAGGSMGAGAASGTPTVGAVAPGGAIAPGSSVGPGGTVVGPAGDPSAGVPGAAVPGGAPSVSPSGVASDPSAVVPTTDGTTPVTTPGTTPATTPAALDCSSVDPGPAPVRRLTQFEYNNTVRDLLQDDTNPGDALPPELLGNGYGNDAAQQPVSNLLAEQYGVVADDIATRQVASQFPCVTTAGADTEEQCVQSIIESFGADAYRHDLTTDEVDELVALYDELRPNGTFQEAVASLVSAILQSPDFLYRIERGVPDATNPALLRPTAREMANRLSYLYWGTIPDDELSMAAASGQLDTPEGVRAAAARMLDDDRARPVIRYFFDHFLPINTVTELSRDATEYPTFSNHIGSLMHEETEGFLEHEIFDGTGTWTSALTAPYVWVNEELANYYGIPGVTGSDFRAVDVDPTTSKRMGLLTQGAILAGTTVSNFTNPVRRGGFIIRELMCFDIQIPTDPAVLAAVKPPAPFIPGESSEVGRETARMRYTQHEQLDDVCGTCHSVLDPPGFAMENFDAVGLWRDQENGVTIDATGDISVLGGAFDGPLELAQKLAQNDATYSCFATNWSRFAYGRDMKDDAAACLKQDLTTAFAASGYNIKELLLDLTQTDAFLYLPATEQTP